MRKELQHVQQRTNKECAIAVLAMASGKPYEFVAKSLGRVFFAGVEDKYLVPWLNDMGIWTLRLTRFDDVQKRMRVQWPPKWPIDASTAVVQVATDLQEGKLHYVLVDCDGWLYDPNAPEPVLYPGLQQISMQYQRLYSVTFLWRKEKV